MRDPEDEHAAFYEFRALRLDQLRGLQVAILLGEPGIGKSTALKEEAKRLTNDGERVIHKRLGDYTSDAMLVQDIFASPEILTVERKGTLHLLLDSLDECTLTIPKSARLLIAQLESLQRSALTLRITCRTADWPAHLTEQLRELWTQASDDGASGKPREPVGVYDLLPLREADVVVAAVDRGIPPEAFLDEVARQAIQPFASHPNTLNMLLGIFSRDGKLPKQRAEIFRLGCRQLASELSPLRQEIGLVGQLSPDQRIEVASCVAAVMLFCKRNAVWLGDTWRAEKTDLTELDLAFGNATKTIPGPIAPHPLRETLQSALFSGRGPQRLGFSHQSFAEFLGAKYLAEREFDVARLHQLLGDAGTAIPTPLAEVVAWIASISPSIWRWLVEIHPLVALRADLAALDETERKRLLSSILRALTRQEISDADWGIRERYRQLKYPGLSDDLRPFIVEKSLVLAARRDAMHMVAECGVIALARELTEVVIDSSEDMACRIAAARAAVQLKDPEEMRRLTSLAQSRMSPDAQEAELLPVLVPALWPEELSTEQLFQIVSGGHGLEVLGNFRYFPDEFVGRFTTTDLVVALQWVSSTDKGIWDYDADRLKEDIMAAGWARLDEPGVVDAFADAVWRCFERLEPLFGRSNHQQHEQHPFAADDRKRRFLLEAVLRSYRNSPRGAHRLTLGQDPLALPADFGWLLDRYRIETDVALKELLAASIPLLMRQIPWGSPEVNNLILAACVDAAEAASPLADAVSPYIEPVWLDSPDAEQLREQHRIHLKFEAERPQPLDPRPAERVKLALQRCEEGKPYAWDQLWRELGLADGASHYSLDGADITESPGWKRAGEEDRARIVACALKCAQSVQFEREDVLLPNNQVSYKHIALYLAVSLVVQEIPDAVQEIPIGIWQKWAWAVAAYPFERQGARRARLLRLVYEHAPETVLELLKHKYEAAAAEGAIPYDSSDLDSIWDKRVADLIWTMTRHPGLDADNQLRGLQRLMDHRDTRAHDAAVGLLQRSGEDSETEKLRIGAACLLLECVPETAWQTVWDAVVEVSAFGEQVMLSVGGHHPPFLKRLPEQQLATMYIWLEQHFPAVHDTKHKSGAAYSVTRRDEVAHLRYACIAELSQRGTQEAVDSLAHVSSVFTDADWLHQMRAHAKQRLSDVAFQPVSPAELIRLLERKEARLVRSADELLDVVILSLGRLQAKLTGETPLSPFLWNLTDGERGSPKSEDRLSDFVKYHLEQDLPAVVIGREVQVRNLRESGIGERTDLRIEAIGQDSTRIKLIVETKGCWHGELMSAIQTQLRDQYLHFTDAEAGLYLVGWFGCERWVDTDPRKAKCRSRGDIEGLRQSLAALAKTASINEKRISALVLDLTY
jgi:hypothetical protein